jgi:hypothetical protein
MKKIAKSPSDLAIVTIKNIGAATTARCNHNTTT